MLEQRLGFLELLWVLEFREWDWRWQEPRWDFLG